ncbi:MAG: hypothetical protein NTW08_03590 [Gammaproteobacteria bacterium]|nr:hypothetical protein [Gammaproteobacteria bacterium]
MPQSSLLNEQSVREYTLLATQKLHLEQKISIREQHKQLAITGGHVTKVEEIDNDLRQRNLRLDGVKSELKKFNMVIPKSISTTKEDRCCLDLNQVGLEGIKAEIVRLEQRHFALRIYAVRGKCDQKELLIRLNEIAKAKRSLQATVPVLEAAMQVSSSLNDESHIEVQLQSLSVFRNKRPNGLNLTSSDQMRAVLSPRKTS